MMEEVVGSNALFPPSKEEGNWHNRNEANADTSKEAGRRPESTESH
jgi:hypothetical protein